MLTIENIDKMNHSIGFNTITKVADTHYSFFVYVNGQTIEITLARHKPKFQNGKPHPQSDKYLLQCNHISWKHYWLRYDELNDLWNVAQYIESFINEVK